MQQHDTCRRSARSPLLLGDSSSSPMVQGSESSSARLRLLTNSSSFFIYGAALLGPEQRYSAPSRLLCPEQHWPEQRCSAAEQRGGRAALLGRPELLDCSQEIAQTEACPP